MAAISKIKSGMVLYDYHKERQGNTTISKEGEWLIRVFEVDLENRKAFCSWNGNAPTWISERRLSKYRIKRKERK